MKPAEFVYHAPTTVNEAVALLAEFADEGMRHRGRAKSGSDDGVPYRGANPPN